MEADRPLRIYIAGPYSHPRRSMRQINTDIAMDAALGLLMRGHYPYCPHLSHYLDERHEAITGETLPYQTWMDLVTAYLSQCDALLYLGSSPGADIELKIAWEQGLTIYLAEEEVPSVPGCLAEQKGRL